MLIDDAMFYGIVLHGSRVAAMFCHDSAYLGHGHSVIFLQTSWRAWEEGAYGRAQNDAAACTGFHAWCGL
jgi:hypothetical protein